MSTLYACDFNDISRALATNPTLRAAVVALIQREPMPGKVTEGGDRLTRLRGILRDVAEGRLRLAEAYARVAKELPRQGSVHAASNRVFADGWEERLVRTQLSRCYNQAVLGELVAAGKATCFVPHSDAEASDSPCSRQLAGGRHDPNVLLKRLLDSYRNGNWGKEVKIPNHPHCTHVVVPDLESGGGSPRPAPLDRQESG